MDFVTGNSGSLLLPAVFKTGPECLQEGAYCEVLGKDVTPRILCLTTDGYVMEKLEKAARHPDLLCQITELLKKRVWSRPSQDYDVAGKSYKDHHKELGLEVPDWAVPTSFCMTHGDPTASNTLLRNGQLILCDPRPPRAYVPQCRESDMARIMQSYFGWEVAAYGEPIIRYKFPDFWLNPSIRHKVSFWLAATTLRIEKFEFSKPKRRESVVSWCREVRIKCLNECGL